VTASSAVAAAVTAPFLITRLFTAPVRSFGEVTEEAASAFAWTGQAQAPAP